jgi:hypothetical protein
MNLINGQKMVFLKKHFLMFMKENYFKISKVKQNKKINLFIDVIKISNKLGSEFVTINCEYRKKM